MSALCQQADLVRAALAVFAAPVLVETDFGRPVRLVLYNCRLGRSLGFAFACRSRLSIARSFAVGVESSS